MPTVPALVDHRPPSRASISLRPGEAVLARRLPSPWPAFSWVETETGGGWVPTRYLSAPEGPATVMTAYDTTELPVRAGDPLTILVPDPESGWSWCRDARGREGWVPDQALDEGA